jgi:hypothetical protein
VSLEAMAVVLHHSRATGTDKLVLLGIANHQGDGGAWPSVATLAAYANVHERTVQRSVHKLQQLGELAVHLQRGGTLDSHRFDFQRPNRYEVLLSCPSWCDGTYSHRARKGWREVGDGTMTTEPEPATLPGLEPVEPCVLEPDAEPLEPEPLTTDRVQPGAVGLVDVELPDALAGPCVACGRPAHALGTPTCCGLCAHQAVELVEPHAHRYSGGRCVAVPGCSARVQASKPAPSELLQQLRADLERGPNPVDKPGDASATG